MQKSTDTFVVILVFLAACGSNDGLENCTPVTQCPTGDRSYKLCTNEAATSCEVVVSGGNVVACTSCAACTEVAGACNLGFAQDGGNQGARLTIGETRRFAGSPTDTYAVSLGFENTGAGRALVIAPGLFAVESVSGAQIRGGAIDSACAAIDSLAVGGNLACTVAFALPKTFEPIALSYTDGSVTAMSPIVAAPKQPENTLALCMDGEDNDGDGYYDCGDSDCCDVASNCGSSTFCGMQVKPETSDAACRDGIDNDHDGYVDCRDASCCAVRSDCPSGTYCHP